MPGMGKNKWNAGTEWNDMERDAQNEAKCAGSNK